MSQETGNERVDPALALEELLQGLITYSCRVQKGFKIGWDIAAWMEPNFVEKLISTMGTDGPKNFSETKDMVTSPVSYNEVAEHQATDHMVG